MYARLQAENIGLKEHLSLQQQTNEALFREHEITMNLGVQGVGQIEDENLSVLLGRLSVGIQND